MSEQENARVLNPDMITAIYRLAVVILLAGILVVQWQILGSRQTAPGPTNSMNAIPTFGDLRTASDQSSRQAIIDNAILVRVQGGFINSGGTVEIDSASVAQIRGGR